MSQDKNHDEADFGAVTAVMQVPDLDLLRGLARGSIVPQPAERQQAPTEFLASESPLEQALAQACVAHSETIRPASD
jgi:hypothetical protein